MVEVHFFGGLDVRIVMLMVIELVIVCDINVNYWYEGQLSIYVENTATLNHKTLVHISRFCHISSATDSSILLVKSCSFAHCSHTEKVPDIQMNTCQMMMFYLVLRGSCQELQITTCMDISRLFLVVVGQWPCT